MIPVPPVASIAPSLAPATTALRPAAFLSWPLPAVTPCGWLRTQLAAQAAGLSGHLDEIWPCIGRSRWIGGEHEGWERGPYWLDGLIPLAFLLRDERLVAKARHWVDAILAGQDADGWLGAKHDAHEGIGQDRLDPWPLFIVAKALLAWADATDDARVVPALLRCARRIDALLAAEPLTSWAQMRWMELTLSLHALHERTGEAWLLSLADRVRAQGFDWAAFYRDAPPVGRAAAVGWEDAAKLRLHGVNNAMAVKAGFLRWRETGDPADREASNAMIAHLETHHGQVSGMFSGDEHLAGDSPAQGTETCTVVEYMFSLEVGLRVTGEAALADRLERVALNALPAALTEDFWARQYDQQPNQISVSRGAHHFVSNGPEANLFSFEGHFGCCTANFHQGWPKLAHSVWLRTPAGDPVNALLLPARLSAGDYSIECVTDYPFAARVRYLVRCARPVEFALTVRVPGGARSATARLGKQTWTPVPGAFWTTPRRVWHDGDELVLDLDLFVRAEPRPRGAACLCYGPLVLALPVAHTWTKVGQPSLDPRLGDWEARPLGPWNYALAASSIEKASTLEPQTRPVGSRAPFCRREPPLTVSVKARRFPGWIAENDDAPSPPPAPLAECEAEEIVQLVPYGATTLRIAEFPVVRAT